MTDTWQKLLEELDAYDWDRSEPIPETLRRLTDQQVQKLEDALCHEGLRRGFSRWWWE